jgi:hypothetical protein
MGSEGGREKGKQAIITTREIRANERNGERGSCIWKN